MRRSRLRVRAMGSRGLKSAFNVAGGDAAHTLKQAGYGVNEVGDALKSIYGSGADDTARMLRSVGCNVNETGNYVKSVFPRVGGPER